jgi:alkylhydroperoxidase/carboxymuconolactone decarboxylase family protein YurZ
MLDMLALALDAEGPTGDTAHPSALLRKWADFERHTESATMSEPQDDLRKIVSDFKQKGGYWIPGLEGLIELSPDFLRAYIKFASVPIETGSLHPRIKELIYLAVNASTTLLYEPGIRSHIRGALNSGATKEEVMEVLQLTSVIGIHTCTIGVPILLQELASLDQALGEDIILNDPKRRALRDDFREKRGYWNDVWNGVLILSPEFFSAFLEFSAVPWRTGPLEPKIKEFIYIAIDTATTHLFSIGTYIHVENALKYGATKEEIMEVMQLASIIGVHSCTLGVPILEEELRALSRQA